MSGVRRGRKIPSGDAFAYYVALGPERSYGAVAAHYGASQRAVQKTATREKWTARLESIETAVQTETADLLKETLVEMRSRHLKTLRVVHTRAVEALRDRRFDSAMEGVRALDIAVKLERLIAGEASTRADLVVRELRRREEDQLLVEDVVADAFVDEENDFDGEASLGQVIQGTGGEATGE